MTGKIVLILAYTIEPQNAHNNVKCMHSGDTQRRRPQSTSSSISFILTRTTTIHSLQHLVAAVKCTEIYKFECHISNPNPARNPGTQATVKSLACLHWNQWGLSLNKCELLWLSVCRPNVTVD